MQDVCQFLKDARTYYLATAEGDQPRVRPFGTAHIFEDKLYIQTGKSKPTYAQITANPKVEICAFNGSVGQWLRVTATLVEDPRVQAEASLLEAYPELQGAYQAGDGNTAVFYLRDAEAIWYGFGAAGVETVKSVEF
ncbi:MAG: pyridoxamine 5'-phosphate oxidase family protein [Coriobacteriales bacterium]|nr:pyridoxamine 5'-phosphate oxidase family protein [Coriobacteriales bacterium]